MLRRLQSEPAAAGKTRQHAIHGLTRVRDGHASRDHLRAGLNQRVRWTPGPPPGLRLSGLFRQCLVLRAGGRRRTGPGQTTHMLRQHHYLPGKRPRLCAARQSPGCRVIGPFKSKLSAAGNKTLPFNSGIIRSGLETSRGRAFIEKRWENEILNSKPSCMVGEAGGSAFFGGPGGGSGDLFASLFCCRGRAPHEVTLISI